jgi:hypothetical protein
MCDGELHEGTPDENESEHTPPNAVTRNAAYASGATIPPLVEQLRP